MNAQTPSKKNVTLSTKVSFDDVAILDGKAALAGLTRSTFIRQAAISGNVVPRVVIPEINQAQWVDLGRVGGNLNQIACHLNEGKPIEANLSLAIEATRKVLSDVRSVLIGLEVIRDR